MKYKPKGSNQSRDQEPLLIEPLKFIGRNAENSAVAPMQHSSIALLKEESQGPHAFCHARTTVPTSVRLTTLTLLAHQSLNVSPALWTRISAKWRFDLTCSANIPAYSNCLKCRLIKQSHRIVVGVDLGETESGSGVLCVIKRVVCHEIRGRAVSIKCARLRGFGAGIRAK